MLKHDGSVWATGVNKFGQLGIDAMKYTMTANFLKVLSGDVRAVAVGDGHSMVLKQDGSVWTTGWNIHGQLGDGSKTDRDHFVQVILGYAKAVAAGGKHSLVVMQDGSVWATGFNLHGQLGDGSKTGKSQFLQVISNGVEAVAAGSCW